jgi:polysaccharide export outer membrane protein
MKPDPMKPDPIKPAPRKRSLAIWACLCLLPLAVAGCAASPRPQASIQSTVGLSIPDTTSLVRSADLRISPLDVVEVRVFGVEQLNGTYQVDPSGDIKVPLVGVVKAQGLTSFDLAADLETRLAAFVKSPQVSVRVSETLGQAFTVDGAVENPGIYPVRGSMTLLQALAVSGGTSEVADNRRVLVFRTIDGEKRAAAFDLEAIRRGTASDPPVYGNDVIVVDGSGTKASYRELLRAIPVLGLFLAL